MDDVDSHSILSDGSDLDGLSRESSSQNSASQTPLDSPGGPRERIKQIQVEAETRRGEFARLLEEHAQVVRKLKMMEAEEQLSATTTTTTTGNATVIGGANAWFYGFFTTARTRVPSRVGTIASIIIRRPSPPPPLSLPPHHVSPSAAKHYNQNKSSSSIAIRKQYDANIALDVCIINGCIFEKCKRNTRACRKWWMYPRVKLWVKKGGEKEGSMNSRGLLLLFSFFHYVTLFRRLSLRANSIMLDLKIKIENKF